MTVKWHTFFSHDPWVDTTNWLCTRVVPLWSPQIVLMLRSAISDQDVCDCPFSRVRKSISVPVDSWPHGCGWSSRHVCERFRAMRVNSGGKETTSVVGAFYRIIPELLRKTVCHQVWVCSWCVCHIVHMWKSFACRVASFFFCFGCLWFSEYIHRFVSHLNLGPTALEWLFRPPSWRACSSDPRKFWGEGRGGRGTISIDAHVAEIPVLEREDACHQVGFHFQVPRCVRHSDWLRKSVASRVAQFLFECVWFSVSYDWCWNCIGVVVPAVMTRNLRKYAGCVTTTFLNYAWWFHHREFFCHQVGLFRKSWRRSFFDTLFIKSSRILCAMCLCVCGLPFWRVRDSMFVALALGTAWQRLAEPCLPICPTRPVYMLDVKRSTLYWHPQWKFHTWSARMSATT